MTDIPHVLAGAQTRATGPRPWRSRWRSHPVVNDWMIGALLVAAMSPAAACVVVPGDEEPTTTDATESSADTSATSATGATSATSDPDTGNTGETDTGEPTGGEPTGGEPGEGCFDDPTADARFSLELDGWPATQQSLYEIAAACTVLDVQADGTDLVTTLECDDGGELRPATMRVAATAEGMPSWSPTSAVALAYYHFEDKELGTGTYRSLSLRRADDQALLVAAIDGDGVTWGKWLGNTPGEYLAPVVATEDREYCGWVPDLPDRFPMRIILDLEGESLDLVSGQIGVLPIPGQADRLAVDLGDATVGYCCHYTTWFNLLVRRVS